MSENSEKSQNVDCLVVLPQHLQSEFESLNVKEVMLDPFKKSRARNLWESR